jgi:hypothetical protein
LRNERRAEFLFDSVPIRKRKISQEDSWLESLTEKNSRDNKRMRVIERKNTLLAGNDGLAAITKIERERIPQATPCGR